MSVTSEASTSWKGSLTDGSGEIALESSNQGPFAVDWKARSEGSASVTTPEELLAAAHSSCFSMALSHALAGNGTPPESIETTASVTFIPGTGITGSHLNVNAVVPGCRPRTSPALPAKRRRDAPSRPRWQASRSPSRPRLPENDSSRAEGRVVVAGASGLIGRALVASLRADGIAVTRLVRRPSAAPDELSWDPASRPLPPSALEGARAVVGLNGATLGHFPWTRRYKHDLVWSRIAPTQALAAAVRALGDDAPHFVSSSAVGYYPSARESPSRSRRPAETPSSQTSAASGRRPRHAAPEIVPACPCCGPRRWCTPTVFSSPFCC